MNKLRILRYVELETNTGERRIFKPGKLLSVKCLRETDEDGYVDIVCTDNSIIPYVDDTIFEIHGAIPYEKRIIERSDRQSRNQEAVCQDELSPMLWSGVVGSGCGPYRVLDTTL